MSASLLFGGALITSPVFDVAMEREDEQEEVARILLEIIRKTAAMEQRLLCLDEDRDEEDGGDGD